MVTDAFKKVIIPFKNESYHQYTEEKESDWLKYPDKFDELSNEKDKYDNNYGASFNLKDGGTKTINISEIKRFVDDVNSGNTDSKKVQQIDV